MATSNRTSAPARKPVPRATQTVKSQALTALPDSLHPHAPNLRRRPDFYMPSDESLDFLLDQQIESPEALEPLIDRKAASDLNDSITMPWDWFSNFLEALQWRIDLSRMALDSRTPSGDSLGVNPEFAGQRAEFSRLLADVMAAYVPAMTSTTPYNKSDGSGDAALLELLRRYWVFNRRVMAFAREVWGHFHIWDPAPPGTPDCECERKHKRLRA